MRGKSTENEQKKEKKREKVTKSFVMNFVSTKQNFHIMKKNILH